MGIRYLTELRERGLGVAPQHDTMGADAAGGYEFCQKVGAVQRQILELLVPMFWRESLKSESSRLFSTIPIIPCFFDYSFLTCHRCASLNFGHNFLCVTRTSSARQVETLFISRSTRNVVRRLTQAYIRNQQLELDLREISDFFKASKKHKVLHTQRK